MLKIFFLYNSTQTISVLLDLTLKAQSFFFLNKVYILQYGSNLYLDCTFYQGEYSENVDIAQKIV